jgi:hypothetical protein
MSEWKAGLNLGRSGLYHKHDFTSNSDLRNTIGIVGIDVYSYTHFGRHQGSIDVREHIEAHG